MRHFKNLYPWVNQDSTMVNPTGNHPKSFFLESHRLSLIQKNSRLNKRFESYSTLKIWQELMPTRITKKNQCGIVTSI